MAWLVIETVIIAGANDLDTTLQALPVVAWQTQFGQWLLLRGALLVVVVPLLQPRRVWFTIATVVAAFALGVQPMLGHAGAIGGSLEVTLVGSEVMHLLAAGSWLGSLLPLFITIGTLPHKAAATACRSFTPVGLSATVVLAGTAMVQVTEFMGGMPGLFGTGYGHVALLKLGLFIVLLSLAALNRLALTNRLEGTAPGAARRHMRVSIAIETVLGAAVVITAGFLATHEPGTHEEPVWPFPWRLSLAALSEPDLRGEVVGGLRSLGAAGVIAIVGIIWRRVRWPAPGGRRHRRTGGPASRSAAGRGLSDQLLHLAHRVRRHSDRARREAVRENCVACHGAEGHGDGPAANSLPIHPADLTAQHLWAHTDGEMFWYLTHGFDAPDGSLAMSGFETILSSEARWDRSTICGRTTPGRACGPPGCGRIRCRCRSSMRSARMANRSTWMICEGACCASLRCRVMMRRLGCRRPGPGS